MYRLNKPSYYFIVATLCLMMFPAAVQGQLETFFTKSDAFFKAYVTDGKVKYDRLANTTALDDLIKQVEETSLLSQGEASIKAFYINAYNLLVIKGALSGYPLSSVQDIPNFFDRKDYIVAGARVSLNQLEKDILFPNFPDPRLHFVLVCGALGCPPITDFAYVPESLDQQLDRQTRLALNDPAFIRLNAAKKEVGLSQIFSWYPQDFGGSKANIITYINQYRDTQIPASAGVSYYPYDWSINDSQTAAGSAAGTSSGGPITSGGANNSIRYVVSSTIPKGTIETKIFNNLYSQVTRSGGELSNRSTFFTTFVTSIYGVSDYFNAGVEVRYRSVLNADYPSSSFAVFGGGNDQSFRQGIATIGPKIRWAPIPKWGNFSVQSAIWFPVMDELEGGNGRPFVDWNNATWWTQVFNDFTLGNSFSLFTEVDFLWEDIGSGDNGAFNRVSTPVTLILSYFPEPQLTVYALNGFSPYWAPEWDYFYQAGAGAKYQFTRQLELEVLYTYFTNQFLQENNGRASTVNLGFRFNL
ncbi:MAG: DUF547 domain-containing protein [Bacteroidota bacterium]